jgi:hypothetical protein
MELRLPLIYSLKYRTEAGDVDAAKRQLRGCQGESRLDLIEALANARIL